jgi:tetratricopeptide (TPR) repeat protein
MSSTRRPEPTLSVEKRRLFTVAMWLLPLVFFAALEGVLRLSGYGETYPLFVPVPGFPDFYHQNRDVARRYFTRQARVPTSLNDAFAAEKDSTTFRIFVQGGSSAAGYPYYYGGSFSRMLEQRLQQTFPDRTIEVVNTAMAAVNSYTMLDFADEIIAQQPDAVLIYAGHNEYYGALGVASAESLGQFRWMVNAYLRLRNLRIVQGLRALLEKGAALLAGDDRSGRPSATLMERMVGEQSIPYHSPTYERGLAQFRGNLRDLLEKYRARGIPVFIGTVASNERTHAPFLSGLAPETDKVAWHALFREATQAVEAGETATALAVFDELIRRDSLSAEAFFSRARTLDAAGRFPEARVDYLAAKDRDQLRFRAPEAVNRIIREEAERAGATVVETQAALVHAARDGIIGSDLMLEHLHPNVDGYFTISDAFYRALHDARLIGPWRRFIPAKDARAEVLLTPVDSLFGVYRVRQLMGSWPFRPPGVVDHSMDTVRAANPVEELALALFRREKNWLEVTTSLRNHYAERGDFHQALRAALALIQQYPYLAEPYAAAADLLVRQRRYDEALAYFEAANDRQESAGVHYMIGALRLAKGESGPALEHLERARTLNPDDPRTLYQLGRAYAAANQTPKARATLERLLTLDPQFAPARALLDRLPPDP